MPLTGLVVHEPPHLPRVILQQPAPLLQEEEGHDTRIGDLLRARCEREHRVARVEWAFQVEPLEKGDALPRGILRVQLEREG